MTTKKPRADRPTRPQTASVPIGERTIEFMTLDGFTNIVRTIDLMIDRITPRHLKACTRPGCVDPVVTVLHDSRTDHVERLCAKHTQVIARALAYDDLRAASERLSRRQRAEFDRLEPAMQYGLEGR